MNRQLLRLPMVGVLSLLSALGVWWVLPGAARLRPLDAAAPAVSPSAAPVARPPAAAPAPPLAPAKPNAKAAGLLQRITMLDGPSAGQSDTRTARMVALYAPVGDPVSPFLAAGRFSSVWEGDLQLHFRDEYTFSADGRGRLTLTVNGQVVLDTNGEDLSKTAGKAVTLNRGYNAIVARYEAPADGDAWVRLYWRSAEKKIREPIPWLAWAGFRRHDATDEALRTASRLRLGRETVAERRCLRCHVEAATPTDMPELAMDAPSLKDAGSRLRTAWMAKWLVEPRALRPTSVMPVCLSGPDAPRQAADVAAYLATLTAGSAPAKPDNEKPDNEKPDNEKPDNEKPDETIAAAGGRLFAQLGCATCHSLPTNDDWAEDKVRVPLRFVSTKWQSGALASFLRQPDRHYQWIAMPNFRLSEEEADQLQAFLLSAPAVELNAAGGGDAARGKTLVAAAGCASCHGLPEEAASSQKPPRLAAIPADGWARGCLSPEVAKLPGHVPNFELGTAERDAVVALAASDRSSLHRRSAVEFANRQISKLRCLSCHKRDENQEDPWADLAEETGPLLAAATAAGIEDDPEEAKHFPPEQVRPTLTWAGEKLRPEWTAKFLAGQIAEKPRPWLRARMPAYPARAALLAAGMALDHGRPAKSPAIPAPDPAKAELGRQLARKVGGFNCGNCHTIAAGAAVGVFEAPGVNFARVSERLTRDYYDRWMIDPVRVEPGTKMPQFYKGGKTDIAMLGGDADAQFDALWHYLLLGDKIKPPPAD